MKLLSSLLLSTVSLGFYSCSGVETIKKETNSPSSTSEDTDATSSDEVELSQQDKMLGADIKTGSLTFVDSNSSQQIKVSIRSTGAVFSDINKLIAAALPKIPENARISGIAYVGPEPVYMNYSSTNSIFESCNINSIFSAALAKPNGGSKAAISGINFKYNESKPCRSSLKFVDANSPQPVIVSIPSSGTVFSDINKMLAAALPKISESARITSIAYVGLEPVYMNHSSTNSTFESCNINSIFSAVLAKPNGGSKAAISGINFKFNESRPCHSSLTFVDSNASQSFKVTMTASGAAFSDVNKLLEAALPKISEKARITKIAFFGPKPVYMNHSSIDSSFESCDINLVLSAALAKLKGGSKSDISQIKFNYNQSKACLNN
ncbi:MAG: hypothetical protein NT027_14620 [Proteobacteria bacterium]|nr:hypothetical protein [Pseudomonadota bacterium]